DADVRVRSRVPHAPGAVALGVAGRSPRGGRRPVARCVRAGDNGEPPLARALIDLPGTATTRKIGEGRSPTLSDAPLAQRQSNGLLIRRFRVQIPRGALVGCVVPGDPRLVLFGRSPTRVRVIPDTCSVDIRHLAPPTCGRTQEVAKCSGSSARWNSVMTPSWRSSEKGCGSPR